MLEVRIWYFCFEFGFELLDGCFKEKGICLVMVCCYWEENEFVNFLNVY